jgi:DNA-binding response OmpR family regulator
MENGSNGDRGRSAPGLAGLRVLVVEDRGLIAAKIAQILRQAGCTVVGPAATLTAGMDLARCKVGRIDVALLDIDLRGELVYPLAKALQISGVQILFLTGYGEIVIPEAWRDAPRLEKPIDPVCLREAVQRLATNRPLQNHDAGRFFGNPPPVVCEAWKTIRRKRDLIMESEIRIRDSRSGLKRPLT